jgi:hypothetical protein
MKKLFLAAAAVAAFGAATPASAQFFPQGIQGLFGIGGIGSRLAMLDRQIEIAFQRGELTPGEASRLRSELVQLSQLEQSFRIDGLSRAERRELDQRLSVLERRIQLARFDDDRFDDRWDDNDRRFGRNGCPPGLAKKNNGCMPPGLARQGGNRQFGAMYGDRFQDSQRFVYRQEGGRMLQIDRFTGQVVRVFDLRR